LADGSRVLLNRGAAIRVEYSPAERRVRMERGEAQFDVEKNPRRPFVVDAGAVRVRAVGTAFDVRFGERTVSVLVTEGSVRLDGMTRTMGTPPEASAGPAHAVSVLAAGQQAEVSIDSGGPAPQVKTVSHEYIQRILAWQPQLLDFTAAPLSDIIAEFNRHNIVQLTIVGPDLAALRISASFRSDNVDGFVSLLESSFGVQVERRGRCQIVLRSSR
jgi:transmembrane sensor